MSSNKDIFNEIIERLKDPKARDAALKKAIEDFAAGEAQPDPVEMKQIKIKPPKKNVTKEN